MEPRPDNSVTADETRPFVRNRSEGYVIDCDGMRAVISSTMKKDGSASDDYWSVGNLLSIVVNDIRTIGILYKVEAEEPEWHKDGDNKIKIYVELVGEIRTREDGSVVFFGGISAYPHLGAIAHRIRASDLEAVFANTDPSVVELGRLSQNTDIAAQVAVDSILSRHFAVVGMTGVGKSSAVTLMMRKIIEVRPDVRILILDPHNEFSSAFPDKSIVITDSNLNLPFWAFKLEEFAEVLFRGLKSVPEEVEILRDMIARAKAMYKGDESLTLRRKKSGEKGLTADTPVPYRIADLTRLLDDEIGRLGNSENRPHIKSLMARITAISADPNFRFMFSNMTVEDNLSNVLSDIFRVPANGKPITAFQLNGIPSEVVNSVVSVLCRMAFDLAVWSDSKIKTLVLCEEAHRYIPSNRDDGFGPTRQAIARIAKEGRKYGVSLGIVTQRPGELDETILSQCNTLVAMRLGNDIDQNIMRRAIAGASQSFINFLPSLGNREAIMFGQGVSTPMRMRFADIPKHELPANNLIDGFADKSNSVEEQISISSVLSKIRHSTYRSSPSGELDAPVGEAVVGDQRPSIAPEQNISHKPMDQTPAMFEDFAPIRRETNATRDGSYGAGQQRPTRPQAPPSGQESGNSIINRFRSK